MKTFNLTVKLVNIALRKKFKV